MKLKFDSNLEYQLNAIKSVLALFKGQKLIKNDALFIAENGVIPNQLNINESKLLENLNQIQKENNLELSKNLETNDFSIEMETGTGKTYVYLRTILELNKEYDFKKFIIIVPSVAIKEGVIKTLQITKNHFKELYNINYQFNEYDSSNLSKIRQFSRNNNVEILIMTLDSFNKESNIMNQNIDKLHGEKPIDLVSKTNPVLILDEPQNMESKKSKEALDKLNSLFKLRYSATHKEYYNLIYRLTPFDAYNNGLVKRIDVLSVIKDEDYNGAYLKCLDITANEKGITAKIEVNVKLKSSMKKKIISIKKNDDLFKKTNNEEYKNFLISGIHAGDNQVKFSNGVIIKKGEEQGTNKKELMKIQIKETIEEHFRKQLVLKPFNIKVLSLFFIDKVSNYKDKEGFIKKIFTDYFNQIKLKYEEFKNLDVNKVHKGYFSDYKTDLGMERDKEAFDLIMKDKERLLSFEEPVQFIFSHSALKEGWDNPNVFNICTLNETSSNIKKRQEIGRGLRLPVDQKGNRILESKNNVLTVIANESYVDYVNNLQKDYLEEYGQTMQYVPLDARKRKKVKLRKGFELNENFKELWNKISKKTKYSVDVNTNKLIEKCVNEINEKISINKIKIKIDKVSLNLDENKGITYSYVAEDTEEYGENYSIPNLVKIISEETNLTKNTVVEILSKINNLNLLFNNPREFMESVVLIISSCLKEFLLNGIKYVEVNENWKMSLFEEIDAYEDNILVDEKEKSIYQDILFDSKGEAEFAKKLEEDSRVKLFIKLPKWFFVKTPIGNYNPDWVVLLEKQDLFGKVTEKLYLVRETKFVESLDNIRPSELNKIFCAKKHFETINVDFKDIKNYDQLI